MILTLAILFGAGAAVYFLYVTLMILGILRREARVPGTERSSVAVIVAARNEADNLPHLLEDLSRQDYSGPIEFVVANDRSRDHTAAIINRWAKRDDRFKAVHISEASTELTGKKNALTRAIKATQAEILLETDADCRVPSSWVSSMVGQFDEQTGVVVGFSSVRGRSAFNIYQAIDFLGIMMTNAGMLHWGKAWSGSGQNLAFRRRHFTAIGGFRSGPGISIGDDFYLVQELGRIPGVTVRFNAEVEGQVTTAPVPTLSEFYHQRIRWASDSKGLHLKDPLFFSFLASAFITNTLMIPGLFLVSSEVFLIIIGLKFCLELAVIMLGLNSLGRIRDLWLFPVWFLLQPLYIPVVGVAGQLSKIKW